MIRPFPGEREVACEGDDEEFTLTHQGTLRDYNGPGSHMIVVWSDSDRRSFAGEWASCLRLGCDPPGCILPAGHLRECVR